MAIVVFAPTEIEFNSFRSVLDSCNYRSKTKASGTCGSNRIDICLTGMGPKNSLQNSRLFLRNQRADFVLISGLAAGLVKECRVGSVALYYECLSLQAASNCLKFDQGLGSLVKKALTEADIEVTEGRTVTVSKVVSTKEEKRELAENYQAIALDMETHSLATACFEEGLPCVAFRTISDGSETDIPDFGSAFDEQFNTNNAKLLLKLAAHPVLSTRFIIDLRKALKALRKSLRTVLQTDFSKWSLD
ncbi:MAG: hypothetical protein JNN15_06665 [Blastocatellia bacterium]|nr:hypothetical protein [Blastocatellia bacterium]